MQSQSKNTLKIFWQHAWRYKWQVISIAAGVIAHVILQNTGPVLYKRLIDVLTLGDTKSSLKPAMSVVWLILLISAFRLIVARAFNFINNYFQPRVMADLNSTCFEYLGHHSYSFFSNSFVGSLVTKVKRYERAFEQIADQLTFDLGRTLLDTIVIIIILLYNNTKIGLIVLAWAILYIIFSYLYSLYKLPYDIKRAESDTLVTAQLADSITNNFNIKTFANYRGEEAKFKNVAEEQFRLRKKSWDLGTISEVIQSISMVFLEFLLLYMAIKYWQEGLITLGTIALIQGFLIRLFDKLWSVGKHIRAIYESLADAGEMTEILLKPHEIKDVPNAKGLKVKDGAIEFNNVSFSYHKEAEILSGFNINITSGEKVALIGPSGGGKSTIVKLLFRFYDIQGGKILVDGKNIAEVTQDSLRLNMSLVPQDPILFHRSLMENIRYGKPRA